MNEAERQLLKQARKEEKKLIKTAKQLAEDDNVEDFNPETLKAKRYDGKNSVLLITALEMSYFTSRSRKM